MTVNGVNQATTMKMCCRPICGCDALIRKIVAYVKEFFNKIKECLFPKAAKVEVKTETPTINPSGSSAKDWILYFDQCWSSEKKKYQGIEFDVAKFNQLIAKHNEQFPLTYDPNTDYGYIEKRDLEKGSKIFVRADLHGDLKSLMENLKTLQKEGLLDEQFKCKPEAHLVFVGDYADRGEHSMQVLELLMRLKMENPQQVTLIRGNHESVELNLRFGKTDPHYADYLDDEKNWDILQSFYMRMPLTSYLGQKTDGVKQYAQFTHGLFELHIDASPIIDAEAPVATMTVPKERKLSERISRLDKEGTSEKMRASAKRIQELFKRDIHRDENLTSYNWGDMARTTTRLGDTGNRQWKVSVKDVKHYLRVSGAKNKVKVLFRGHEHEMKHHILNGKATVTTLTVGMDSPYKKWIKQADRSYIMTVGAKVKEWQKKALFREVNSSTTTLSISYPMYSTTV